MQKRCMDDGFKTGEYKIIKRKVRRQGETIKKTSNAPAKAVRSFVGFIVVVFMVGMAFMVGMGLNSHTTFYRKFFSKSMGAENLPKTPYKSMAVIETSSGRLLAGYHEEDRLPMASTTKIMTAIVAIEKTPDLSCVYEVPKPAVGVEGSSMYLKAGEKLSMEEYLYGLMLPSGNDSAVAIANIISGSEENFARLMNEYAKNLGLKNTNFVTASGLHHENHYTTSLDLAKLTAYAMKNDNFRKIVGMKNITIKGSDPEKPRFLKNKQKLMSDETLLTKGINVTGVKSGFTPEAGRCLVTSAEFNDMEVVAVVLNAPKMFESTSQILQEVCEDYKMVSILTPKQHIAKVAVSGSEKKDVNLYSQEGFKYPLTAEEEVSTKVKYNYPSILSAPIQKDEQVGEVSVELYGQQIFITPIKAIEEVAENNLNTVIHKLIKNF